MKETTRGNSPSLVNEPSEKAIWPMPKIPVQLGLLSGSRDFLSESPGLMSVGSSAFAADAASAFADPASADESA